MIISRSILLIIRNVSHKIYRENQNTHFVSNNFSENRAVYEIMWKKYGTARQAIDGNIIWRMRFACGITKQTDTHSEYVTLIAFPRQNWLRERASILRYTYTAVLFNKPHIYHTQHVPTTHSTYLTHTART
jgi:hypothetical protein